jgi:hypothetical protein
MHTACLIKNKILITSERFVYIYKYDMPLLVIYTERITRVDNVD